MQSIYEDEEGECKVCGNSVSQNQLDSYDGKCGRCHFNDQDEEEKEEKTYRSDEEIKSSGPSISETGMAKNWKTDEGEKPA